MKRFIFIVSLLFTLFIIFSNPVLAQTPTPTPEPEIIYLQNSPACTDFTFGHTETLEITLTPTPSPETPQVLGTRQEPADPISGDINMTQEKMPDFSKAETIYSKALEWLLPQDLKEGLSIKKPQNLISSAKHFVFGKLANDQWGEPKVKPESNIAFPDYLPDLIGKLRVLGGIFNPGEPAPKSLSIVIRESRSKISNPFSSAVCPATGQGTAEKDNSVTTKSSGFTTASLWTIIENIIGNIFHRSKTTEFKDETATYLPGGRTLIKTVSSFAQNFLPEELILRGKNAPLKSSSSFNASVLGQSQSTHNPDLRYSALGRAQLEHCLKLCSLYPAEIDINSVDPLCPSTACDIESYDFQASGNVDDMPLDQQDCVRDQSNACDYQRIGDGPRCDGDPICESGKCYPDMYRQAKDYTDHGCPVPYAPATDCTDPSVCFKMNLSKNPSGGFGACQYQNQQVCARTDREEVGKCGALCNWACCANQ